MLFAVDGQLALELNLLGSTSTQADRRPSAIPSLLFHEKKRFEFLRSLSYSSSNKTQSIRDYEPPVCSSAGGNAWGCDEDVLGLCRAIDNSRFH